MSAGEYDEVVAVMDSGSFSCKAGWSINELPSVECQRLDLLDGVVDVPPALRSRSGNAVSTATSEELRKSEVLLGRRAYLFAQQSRLERVDHETLWWAALNDYLKYDPASGFPLAFSSDQSCRRPACRRAAVEFFLETVEVPSIIVLPPDEVSLSTITNIEFVEHPPRGSTDRAMTSTSDPIAPCRTDPHVLPRALQPDLSRPRASFLNDTFSGLIVDLGYLTTRILPYFDGYVCRATQVELPLGGRLATAVAHECLHILDWETTCASQPKITSSATCEPPVPNASCNAPGIATDYRARPSKRLPAAGPRDGLCCWTLTQTLLHMGPSAVSKLGATAGGEVVLSNDDSGLPRQKNGVEPLGRRSSRGGLLPASSEDSHRETRNLFQHVAVSLPLWQQPCALAGTSQSCLVCGPCVGASAPTLPTCAGRSTASAVPLYAIPLKEKRYHVFDRLSNVTLATTFDDWDAIVSNASCIKRHPPRTPSFELPIRGVVAALAAARGVLLRPRDTLCHLRDARQRAESRLFCDVESSFQPTRGYPSSHSSVPECFSNSCFEAAGSTPRDYTQQPGWWELPTPTRVVTEGIAAAVTAVLFNAPIDYRRTLMDRVIVIGGWSSDEQFVPELSEEIATTTCRFLERAAPSPIKSRRAASRTNSSGPTALTNSSWPVTLWSASSPKMGRYATWIGARHLATTVDHRRSKCTITREQYLEFGIEILNEHND